MNCNKCNRDRIIVNKTHQLCDDCNFFRLHGKTRFEAAKEKKKEKPRKYSSLKSSSLKRKSIKQKPRKSTGERGVFLEIWEEREHRCSNCKCNLGDIPLVIFFSHKNSKGADPSLRLKKDNINLECMECHTIWEFGNREDFYKRKDMYEPTP